MASFLRTRRFAAFGLLLLAAACGTGHAGNPHQHHLRTGEIAPPTKVPAGWSVSYPISLPHGYSTPTGLAVDPGNGDVWIFSQGPDARLFRWSPSQKKMADSFHIPSNMGADEFTPILIDHAHRAWVGISQTVIVASPGRPALQEIHLPAVKVGAAGSGLPHLGIPNFGAHAGIDAIALGPGRTVVTSRSFATELQTIDVASHRVGTLPLPARTAISGLGAGDLGSGGAVVAAALYSPTRRNELGQLVNGTWTVGGSCGAESVAVAYGTIAVAGDNCIAMGEVPDSGPASIAKVRITGMPVNPKVAVLSRSTIVVTAPGGLVPVTNGRQGPLIPLGHFAAGPSLGGRSTDRRAPVRAGLMSCGTAGKLYIAPANLSKIGLVQRIS